LYITSIELGLASSYAAESAADLFDLIDT